MIKRRRVAVAKPTKTGKGLIGKRATAIKAAASESNSVVSTMLQFVLDVFQKQVSGTSTNMNINEVL